MSFKEVAEAVTKGNLDTVTKEIDDNPDLVTEEGTYDEVMEESDTGKVTMAPIQGTLLTLAAKVGNVEIAKLLIDNGAEVSRVETIAWSEAKVEVSTPLYLAVWNDQREMVKLLLSNGASLDMSALEEAAHRGLLEIVRSVLDSRADVSSNGGELLCKAIQGQSKAIVELLLDGKASVNDGGAEGRSPLVEATRCNSPDIVKLLLSRGAVLQTENKKELLELTASTKGTLTEFVEHAQSDSEKEWRSKTAKSHQEVVQALIESGSLECEPGSLDHVRSLFRQFDQNNDGTIERDELVAVLQNLDKETWTSERIDELIIAADTNKDGKIQFDEFLRWIFGGDDDKISKVQAA
jgi:ankyrin repeat protein